jgi:hypothetical protein
MKVLFGLTLALVSTHVFSQRIIDKEVGNFNEIKVFDRLR